MAVLSPGQIADCANPELDVFFDIGGVPTDVSSLEYIIYEKVTIPSVRTQVFPVSGRATADVGSLCPVGNKLAVGQYQADWTVPDLEPLGSHDIEWFFSLTPTSPEQIFCEEFEVIDINADTNGSTADVFGFKQRFPLLVDRGDKVIELSLDEAMRTTNALCLGNRLADAQFLLAAHLVEMRTNASLAGGATSVRAGQAAVSFSGSNSSDPMGLSRTSYGQMYLRLVFLSGPGARALC